jgi:hypothetical protein
MAIGDEDSWRFTILLKNGAETTEFHGGKGNCGGICLLGDCISVTGSVCLKPLASVSELNEYLFLPLLRSGSLSGL